MYRATTIINILLSFILFLFATQIPVLGQDWDREKQEPSATELWEPVPPKITPVVKGQAPSDAVVLFDGKDLSAWETGNGKDAAWSVEDGILTVSPGKGSIQTKESFGSMQLHIEWRSPHEVEGPGQDQGNSGIFLMSKYEIQVLDSYASDTYSNGQAGSVYKQHAPLVNATLKTGEWNSYDIIFTAPVFGESGRVLHPATVTVLHNGVLIQNNVAIHGQIQYRGMAIYEKHGNLPIVLQDHGNKVSFRNIWVRPL